MNNKTDKNIFRLINDVYWPLFVKVYKMSLKFIVEGHNSDVVNSLQMITKIKPMTYTF